VDQRGWRELHNDWLHNLYSSPDIIRIMKPRSMIWVEIVESMEVNRNTYRVLKGKSVKNETTRRRCEHDIKMDHRKI
jgi:hypothetical protein